MKDNWAKTVVGFLFVVILGWLTAMQTAISGNEKESRDRDSKIKDQLYMQQQKIADDVSDIKQEQQEKFTEVLLSLERLKKDRNTP